MRKKKNYKKTHSPDVKYDSIVSGRFINYIMREGDKSVAEKSFYKAMDIVEKQTKAPAMDVLEKAVENAGPLLEVSSRRIGGANYQIPREVRPERRFFLGCNWIIEAARSKKGKPMPEKLAQEIIAAYKNEGEAIKKKQNMHRMAEANRAFAHFAR